MRWVNGSLMEVIGVNFEIQRVTLRNWNMIPSVTVHSFDTLRELGVVDDRSAKERVERGRNPV